MALIVAGTLVAAEESSRPDGMEYKLKAICLYNFLKFTKWPDESSGQHQEKSSKSGRDPNAADHDSSMVIGVLGDEAMADALAPLQKKTVNGKKVIVRRLGCLGHRKDGTDANSTPAIDSNSLKDCSVIFITSSENDHTQQVVAFLESAPVLTIGEADKFLEAGGMLNFVNADNKVQFEVNRAALSRAHIAVDAEVFRLAKRVVGEEP